MLDVEQLDTVVVAAIDHGRTLPSLYACLARQDVYTEKPLTAYMREGRVLVNTAHCYQRVFQVGT